jgi:hypothetical protein
VSEPWGAETDVRVLVERAADGLVHAGLQGRRLCLQRGPGQQQDDRQMRKD